MRILVYGAGVLGGNLAGNLFRAKQDVTLLARGKWAETIRQNGLIVQNSFRPKATASRLPVITELKPEDLYDVIFVVVRYTQLDSVLDALRANGTKTIVFVGNNARQTTGAAAQQTLCGCFFARPRAHRAGGVRGRLLRRPSIKSTQRSAFPVYRFGGIFATIEAKRQPAHRERRTRWTLHL